MERTINYATNEHYWMMKDMAQANGWKLTDDCGTVQIFRLGEDDRVITVCDSDAAGVDPVAEFADAIGCRERFEAKRAADAEKLASPEAAARRAEVERDIQIMRARRALRNAVDLGEDGERAEASNGKTYGENADAWARIFKSELLCAAASVGTLFDLIARMILAYQRGELLRHDVDALRAAAMDVAELVFFGGRA